MWRFSQDLCGGFIVASADRAALADPKLLALAADLEAAYQEGGESPMGARVDRLMAVLAASRRSLSKEDGRRAEEQLKARSPNGRRCVIRWRRFKALVLWFAALSDAWGRRAGLSTTRSSTRFSGFFTGTLPVGAHRLGRRMGSSWGNGFGRSGLFRRRRA